MARIPRIFQYPNQVFQIVIGGNSTRPQTWSTFEFMSSFFQLLAQSWIVIQRYRYGQLFFINCPLRTLIICRLQANNYCIKCMKKMFSEFFVQKLFTFFNTRYEFVIVYAIEIFNLLLQFKLIRIPTITTRRFLTPTLFKMVGWICLVLYTNYYIIAIMLLLNSQTRICTINLNILKYMFVLYYKLFKKINIQTGTILQVPNMVKHNNYILYVQTFICSS